MARKRRRSGDNRPHRRRPSNPPAGNLPPLPDPRAMEGSTREFLRSLHGESAAETPLERAHEILSLAFVEPSREQRIQYVREALAVCPDCADAYVLLGEHTRSHRKSIVFWEQGVAAGERAWDRNTLKKKSGVSGAFWKLGRTCGPVSDWSMPCGHAAGVRRPCRTLRR